MKLSLGGFIAQVKSSAPVLHPQQDEAGWVVVPKQEGAGYAGRGRSAKAGDAVSAEVGTEAERVAGAKGLALGATTLAGNFAVPALGSGEELVGEVRGFKLTKLDLR